MYLEHLEIPNPKSQINSNDQNSKLQTIASELANSDCGLKSYFLIVNAIPEFPWDLGVLLYLV